MRKTAVTEQMADGSDELREEYRFDYSKAKPHRFAGLPAEPRLVVVLDPDVAEVLRPRMRSMRCFGRQASTGSYWPPMATSTSAWSTRGP